MPLTFEPEAPPLRVDEAGAIRVGQTRVTLATVIRAFRSGESAEDIVHSYPTLSLAEVYGAITYCLRHPDRVEEYLAEYERAAAEIRRRVEEVQGSQAGLRERLLARIRPDAPAEAG